MTAPSLLRFLAALLSGALAVWVVVALWITGAPLTILNTGQTSLIAKDDLLKQCPRSEIVVFGDSRAEAGIDPRLLDLSAVNFARGGGSPVEDYYKLKRYLTCGNTPRVVILSYTLPEYIRLNPLGFWKGTVIAHLLPMADRQEILGRIAAAGRGDAFRTFSDEGVIEFGFLPGSLRNLLYQIYFPLLYAPSVLNSLENGILFRYHDNIRLYDTTLADHGRSDYHPLPHDAGPGREAGLWTGVPNPAIDHYVQGLLTMLQEYNIPALLLVTPVNNATYAVMPAAARLPLMDYLSGLAVRFPELAVPDADLPHWPNQYFGDAAMHLNARGAAAVAAILNRCLATPPTRTIPAACSLAVPPL